MQDHGQSEHTREVKKIFPQDLWELPFSPLYLTEMKRKQIGLDERRGGELPAGMVV